MKKILAVLATSLLCYYSNAQDKKDAAILVNNYMNMGEFGNMIHQNIKTLVGSDKKTHLYKWNEESNFFEKIETQKEIIKPIGYVKFVNSGVTNINLNPEINIETDTSGKTTQVYFLIGPQAWYQYKLIDVATSLILDLDTGNLTSQSSNQMQNSLTRINVAKFLDEFGEDPAKLRKRDSKTFEKKLQEVKNKYSKIIRENTVSLVRGFASTISSRISYMENTSATPYYRVKKDEDAADEKKLKYINFLGGQKDNIKVGNEFDMYQIVDFEGQKTTKYVSTFLVDEVGVTESKAKIILFGKKKEVADLIRENAELYLFENKKSVIDYNKQLNKNSQFYNVGVRKNCLFCELNLEKNLINVPVINTLERNAPELRYFQELAKLEKFIDFKSEELLNKQLGIKYLFYVENRNLMATDIETGRVVGSETSKYSQSFGLLAKNLFMDVFDKNIKFIKNHNVSKNKVKDVIIYSDFGLSPGEKVKVYTLVEEKVGAKVLKRKEELGSGYVLKSISDFVGILNIQKGEKEIFEAQNQKTTLYFEYLFK